MAKKLIIEVDNKAYVASRMIEFAYEFTEIEGAEEEDV